MGDQLCEPPEFFQLLSSIPKPMSPTTIPHKRPPSELAGCDAIPLAKIIEPAKITIDAAIDFIVGPHATGRGKLYGILFQVVNDVLPANMHRQ